MSGIIYDLAASFFYLCLFQEIHSISSAIIENEKPSIEDAFLVNEKICSGTLIHPDWIITAAHCMESSYDEAVSKETSKFGDTIYNFREDDLIFPVNVIGTNQLVSELWRSPNEQKNITHSLYPLGWRHAIQIICDKSYINESLSWKGNDFCLIKLSQNEYTKSEGHIVPACLPSKDFIDLSDENNYYTAGYGQRRMSFCMTDYRGPEKFALCNTADHCREMRQSTRCRVSFEYENKKHSKCLKNVPNPSHKDNRCVQLFNEFNSIDGPIHLFDDEDEYIKTCYPNIEGVGWCRVRDAGSISLPNLSSQSGWGYCSLDDSVSQCDELNLFWNKIDTKAIKVDLLPTEICDQKLGENLKVEQPQVKAEEYTDTLKKYSVFCAGHMHKYPFEKDSFFKKKQDESFTKVSPTEERIKKLLKTNQFTEKYLEGGPNCFGDSGGPIWKYSTIAKSGKVGPVLVGVFSFMLWGTCLSRQEPPFYGRVKTKLDWIYQYVPKNEVCQG